MDILERKSKISRYGVNKNFAGRNDTNLKIFMFLFNFRLFIILVYANLCAIKNFDLNSFFEKKKCTTIN